MTIPSLQHRPVSHSHQALDHKTPGAEPPAPMPGATDTFERSRSSADIKQLFNEKIHPAIKKSLESGGLSVNDSNCEKGAAMTKYALDKLGVGGAELKVGKGHAFVEVKTRDGKTVILDSTGAQFWRDKTPGDAKLQQSGFAGTRDDLRRLMENHIEDHGAGSGLPAVAVDSYRGRPIPKELEADARKIAREDVKPAVERAIADYTDDGKTVLDKTAKAEMDWARGDRSRPLMLVGPGHDEQGRALPFTRVERDESQRFRKMYGTLDAELTKIR